MSVTIIKRGILSALLLVLGCRMTSQHPIGRTPQQFHTDAILFETMLPSVGQDHQRFRRYVGGEHSNDASVAAVHDGNKNNVAWLVPVLIPISRDSHLTREQQLWKQILRLRERNKQRQASVSNPIVHLPPPPLNTGVSTIVVKDEDLNTVFPTICDRYIEGCNPNFPRERPITPSRHHSPQPYIPVVVEQHPTNIVLFPNQDEYDYHDHLTPVHVTHRPTPVHVTHRPTPVHVTHPPSHVQVGNVFFPSSLNPSVQTPDNYDYSGGHPDGQGLIHSIPIWPG